MDYETWQAKRKALQELEIKERSNNPFSSRPNIQASITEQAVRELYDRVEALEARKK